MTGLPSQGKARRRGEISPDARNPDNAWTPANTGANEEAVLGRDIFKHLAELGAQTFRRQACGIDQQLIERCALQRRDAQCGQDLLLPDSLLQRAQRQVRSFAGSLRFHDRRVAATGDTHGR